MSTVLVTGGLGFIGRHMSRHLGSLGWRVIGVGHGQLPASDADEAGLHRWWPGDVSCEAIEAMAEQIDLIVHCAGSSAVGDSFRDPDAEFRKNASAIDGVLAFAAGQTRRPRIVVVSSAAVYGAVMRLPIGESDPLQPISPYGKSKLAIEQRCHQAASEHELQISIVRLFSVYGIGLRKQLFWDACRKFANGDCQFGGSGAERRDWLHVRDAVRLVEIAAQHASSGVPVINGGCGKSVAVSDALSRIRALWGMSPPLAFSGQQRPGDPPGYEADISKARSLGWMPKEDFNNGLAEYVSWARGILGS